MERTAGIHPSHLYIAAAVVVAHQARLLAQLRWEQKVWEDPREPSRELVRAYARCRPRATMWELACMRKFVALGVRDILSTARRAVVHGVARVPPPPRPVRTLASEEAHLLPQQLRDVTPLVFSGLAVETARLQRLREEHQARRDRESRELRVEGAALALQTRALATNTCLLARALRGWADLQLYMANHIGWQDDDGGPYTPASEFQALAGAMGLQGPLPPVVACLQPFGDVDGIAAAGYMAAPGRYQPA